MKPKPETAEQPESETAELDRFEELARKLIAVPKREIDDARKPKSA